MATNKKDIEKVNIILTDQQKDIVEQLKKLLATDYIDVAKISLNKDSIDNYYSVIYNYMGTGIHIPEEEVNELEFEQKQIQIWKTWTMNF